MSSPTTLPALRLAVARVLVARGEAVDGLTVEYDQWGVSIGTTVCGCVVEWIYETDSVRSVAVARAWAAVMRDLHGTAEGARYALASTRRPERKAAAAERLRRARAALAAAREVEA